ncbi:DUF6282 family protein [Roseiarcaceae bacterium H3SJ34-1]|uniref:DUF6282 family protein n=1 Tax=Terripilifer ovatus TaxID=3032367 RepID=UPI003AB990C3|nr:DUF6282 family protein [Roseiarcaceae bacterium H3SJ34-1]
MSLDPATPTRERCVTSYPARRTYSPGAVFPPEVPSVRNAIDIHCHAHNGQQDALALAKLASINGMSGILYKTIGSITGPDNPTVPLQAVRAELARYCDENDLQPIDCWAGWGVTRDNRPPTLDRLKTNIVDGIAGVWLPVANHANTYFKVGGKPIWWDKTADPKAHTEPMPWDEALKLGFYMLDEHGKLKPEFKEVLHVVADKNVALFFGHATHDEIFEIADMVVKLGIKRAVIDHPFSPFIDLSIAQMKQLADAGIFMNFTYDEISPLLGVDPAIIYRAIREVGSEHCTLSSDAGEPLFPNSVECMRLIRGYMEAFGMTGPELETLCVKNPAFIAGSASLM